MNTWGVDDGGGHSPAPKPSRIVRPNTPDPGTPTIHTCGMCGAQLLIAYGLVDAAAQAHTPRCLGPRLDAALALIERLAGIDPPAPPEVTA